ncbi:MAG: hypothetical protein C5B48_13535 [Candidatus Rokuibacteriota bacterium]|nr:MAG: hypothetical protein C5B48_13535 [Candidatus Rokubacteria bacterium]
MCNARRVPGSLSTVRSRLGVLVEVFRNPELRRLELAWGGYSAGEWAQLVALSVYAYGKGGAAAVGLLGVVRMLPAALALPFGAMVADRFPRRRVLVTVHLLRAGALAATAAALAAGAPLPVVFLLAALAAVCAAPCPPAQWALVPVLARTPQELVAANVSASTLEGLAALLGPTLAGIVLAVAGPATVVGASAVVYVWCAYLVARISTEADPGRRHGGSRVEEALAGFRTLADEAGPRLLVGLFAAQTMVRGLLNVLVVAAALGLLGLGDSSVGFLNAAYGLGALAGAFAAVSLLHRRRLANPFGVGLALWGAPIALLGLWPTTAAALLSLALVGVGNAIVDVSGFTLIQRSVEDRLLGRVFGTLEISVLVAIAVGSALASPLIDLAGIRGALVATGALLPVLALLSSRRLRAIDESAEVPERELELLRQVALFSPLPVTTLEKLASRLHHRTETSGTLLIRQGDHGDLFYLLEEGRVEIVHDGRRVAELGPGQYFGEIALLHDIPRVASVVALTDVGLLALEREVFVAAVAGHLGSERQADDVVGLRLEELRSGAPG